MVTSHEPFSFGEEMRLRPQSRRYAGVGVGCLTVLVAAAAFFCEMHVTAAPIEQTAITAAVTILSCFIMYTSLFDAGRQKGLLEEKYQSQRERYETVRERVRQGDGEALEAFCVSYVEEELRRSRERILRGAGETYAAFLTYQAGQMSREEYLARPKSHRRALRRAERLKPLRLTATMLLCEHLPTRRGLVLSTGRTKVRRAMTALIPTVCGSLVTVAVTMETTDLTPATVIAGIFRIFTLIWTGVRGYAAGGVTVTVDDCTALETKTTLMDLYLSGRQTA